MSITDPSPNLQNIADTYSPSIMFHPQETFYPIDIKTYLKQCNGIIPNQQEAPLTQNMIDDFTWIDTIRKENNTGSRNDAYSFDMTDDTYHTIHGDPEFGPIYSKVTVSDTQYDILYVAFFGRVEPYQICNCCCTTTTVICPSCSCYSSVNGHTADVKHIRVIVDRSSSKIVKCYYGAHGVQGGEWRSSDNVIEDSSRLGHHPVIYSVKHDHSFYPDSGFHLRIFGIIWDTTSGKGSKFIPYVHLIYDPKAPKYDPKIHGWIGWIGSLSQDGISAPYIQPFWTSDPDVSNSPLKRFFCSAWW